MMILHNLKVAWRNLIKYKTQTLVSIVALAVGMVTLAATHFVLKHMGSPSIADEPYYDRCYVLSLKKGEQKSEDANERSRYKYTYTLESKRLKVTPEMEEALIVGGAPAGVEKIFQNSYIGGLTRGSDMTFTTPDSATRTFASSFYVVQAEKLNFHAIRSAVTGEKIPVLRKNESVISETIARQVYGEKNPIGCKVSMWFDQKWITTTIRDVYRAEQLNDGVTNDIYINLGESPQNYVSDLLLLLGEGISPEQVQKEADRRLEPFGVTCEIRSLRESDGESQAALLMITTIIYLISSLILVAALIGFLKMQLQLFRMRRREVSLRRVHGAKGVSIMGLFFCEMIITILFASVAALLLGNLLADYASTWLISYLDEFGWRVEGINESLLVIAVAVAIICATVVWGCVQGLLHSRQAMAAQMHRNRRHTLRNSMLGLQLFISMLFLGGTLALSQLIGLIEKQMNIPPNDDFYARCISVRPEKCESDAGKMLEYLQSEAKGIKQYITMNEDYIRLEELNSPEMEKNWPYAPFFSTLQVSDTAILDFWQRPIKWFLPPEERSNCLLLSDSLYSRLSRLGITDKGSLLVRSRHAFPIGGTFSVLPYMDNNTGFQSNTIIELGADSRFIDEFIIVPEDGEYDRLFTELEQVMQRINPEPVKPTVVNLREKLTGELFLLDNMQRGAWILSVICFVVCFMGIWSSISLDTRSRQKEVAVRKVHGAKRKDVVLLFGRLYLWLIGVACVLNMPLMMLFNALLQEWGESEHIPSELISPVMPIMTSIVVVSLVITVVVGVHIRKVMKLQPADIIAKE